MLLNAIVDPKRVRHFRKGWVGIPNAEVDLLLEQIIVNPTLYLSEMADYLFSKGCKAYSTSQIWQALKFRGLTRKVLEVHAKEQNELRRQEFLIKTKRFTAEQRLYVDERLVYKCNIPSIIRFLLCYKCSHITEQATRRRYGRSPKNVRAFVYKYNRLGHRGKYNARTMIKLMSML